jgi:diadenosine tetraphosphate (Ap4A) HIT family hydrolase
MNATIQKFGWPTSLVKEFEHWVILLRPAQVTLGSLVLAAKSDASAYGALPREAFQEQADVVATIERALTRWIRYERINYLMLMMVDPNVHFHVIPRYSGSRSWMGIEFADAGWPGQPRLDHAVQLVDENLRSLAAETAVNFG